MVDTLVQDKTSVVEPVQLQTEPVVVSTTGGVVTPTSEEVLRQTVAAAVTQALAAETEKSRREIQSLKDRSMAEIQAAQRRARVAEAQISATQNHLRTLDPDAAVQLELAQFRAEKAGRMGIEQEEQVKLQRQEFDTRFHGSLTSFAQSLGVDANDSRIDWAPDATANGDYLEAQKRVLDSVVKIQKANAANLTTSIAAEIEKKIRKDLGVEEANSVSTATSGGASTGVPTDKAKFEQYVAGLSLAEYKKNKSAIEAQYQKF